MIEMLSPNTQAILLLTAPLIAGRSNGSTNLLTPGEYRKLARHLRERERQPADLLSSDAVQLIEDCRHVIDKDRLKGLLGRGFLLGHAVERWQARAIWVVSRADAAYPQRLKTRLKEDSPVLLYGCGERKILDTGGLAVVGSRKVDEKLVEFTQEVGRLTARVRKTLVSGGARGIDQAAMRGALDAGGKVAGVLADSLEKVSMNREHRNLILEGELVLVSPYDPSAGFNVGHAMQRNKVIYALADAALVVSADFNKGGTWAGATEQLDKLRLVPVYVREANEMGKGLEALRKNGALVWSNPKNEDEFDAVFSADVATQVDLYSPCRERAVEAERISEPSVAIPQSNHEGVQSIENTKLEPADELFENVRALALRVLVKPCNASDFAFILGVTKRQAEQWLRGLVEEGTLEKRIKPISYAVRQTDLFTERSSAGSVPKGGNPKS